MKLKSLCAVALAVVFGLTGCENDDPVAVERLSLDKTAMTLTRGESGMLVATIEPENAEDKSVVWSSSDESVATVDEGRITAVAVGRATITARAAAFTATCEVTVEGIPVTQVELDVTSCTLKPGQTVVLTATVLPDEADDRDVAWNSSDESVATVDAAGTVTAVAVGTAVVTAEAGGCEATCEVVVASPEPQVGDIFYSDGTWSTELDGSKTPVGVVFYTGDPTVHDATLRRDHPDCTHGLVVALGEDFGKWMRNPWKLLDWFETTTDTGLITCTTTESGEEPDYLNKIMGYNNTKVIELYNTLDEYANYRVDILNSVVAYREQVPAPAATSDWYLPSAKELSLLCIGDYDDNIWYTTEKDLTRRDLIQSSLQKIEGATALQNFFYWSSSERTMKTVFTIYAGTGNTSSSYKTNQLYIRCVLAF